MLMLMLKVLKDHPAFETLRKAFPSAMVQIHY